MANLFNGLEFEASRGRGEVGVSCGGGETGVETGVEEVPAALSDLPFFWFATLKRKKTGSPATRIHSMERGYSGQELAKRGARGRGVASPSFLVSRSDWM